MKHLAIALLILFATVAHAQQLPQTFDPTGEGLLDSCRYAAQYWDGASVSPQEFGLALNCIGVVRGVTDTLQFYNNITLPKDTNTEQPVKVVMAYLKTHPEELNQRDTFLIVKALRKAFPYKNKR